MILPSTATLKDVAARAGVSLKTASRVLNEHPSVAPETRAAVLAAIDALRYTPDQAARSLRAGVDRCVGVLVDSIGDVFFAELAAAVERRLDEHGYTCLVVSSNRDRDREVAVAQSFVARRCAGMIVAPLDENSLATAALRGTPVVFVDRPGGVAGAVSVVVDDVALSRRATEHLIDHGHSRIALLSDTPAMGTTRLRHEGYRQAMAARGLPVDEELVCSDVPQAADVPPAVTRMLALADPPTAIISTNSRLSLGLIPVLHQFRRTDIAVISYGDFQLAGSLSPAITVIDHSAAAIGEAAVAALLPLMRGGTPPAGGVLHVPCRLIPRGSGELSPVSSTSIGES
ncbi:LacI family DNA-binding transcriptional regulator [Arachnia propionica]|uniref:LacI family transcriptional regulator n=1 Tax=Arachnia propionica TaxID=1750 RepID=A0A3P1WUL2_9ACTN|nr:LacI family DNA-binding transcriptional regulator [Arachnia propionica]RRD49598.1 LacI family transcriptional regulator [Arachnia propionica]